MSRTRPILLLLALFALSVRALVPAGFMPTQSAGGWTLEICTGQGLVKVEVGGKPDKRDGGSAPSICAFAGTLAPLLPSLPLAAMLLALAFTPALYGNAFSVPVVAVARRLRPPLRAPPRF